MGEIIILIILGLIVGALGRLVNPGRDPMPIWLTILIGIGGAIIGGVISRIFIGTAGGFIFALLGAVVLVILYRRVVQHRGITGPSARERPTRGIGL